MTIKEAKEVFTKTGCTGLLALVAYLEQDFLEKGEKLLEIHVTYDYASGGMSIGNPASGQTCLMWCQEFASNIYNIEEELLKKIDKVVEIVDISKIKPCVPTREVL